MFKRSTKITSLLVVAASVASMVPAYAADYKKIDSEDGTVYNAVAYKDGEFYVDGEINGKDEATYYYKDGKYSPLSDIDSGDDAQEFSNKYVEVGSKNDGDYYLDLTSGKVTDDEIAQNTLDDASSALKRKVKKDDPSRYSDPDSLPAAVDSTDGMGDARIASNKFADDWYETAYEASESKDVNGGATSFAVYTDNEGNYIDADYNLGKVSVVTTSGSSVDVKNTSDDKNDARVAVRGIRTIGQDKDYIYRLAKVVGNENVASFGNKSITADDQTTSGAAVGAGYDEAKAQYVLQKISKAQASDEVDGAKYAKTVYTYFITDDKGKSEESKLGDYFTVNNGKVITYTVSDDSIHAYEIDLKTKNGYNYTDFSDGDDQDIENGTDSVQYDVDGNLYALDGGYVYKFNNDDSFEKIYKVDGAFDRFNVYDQNNMVLWSSNTDDEVYSVIGGKDKTSDTDNNNANNGGTTTTAQVGWVQNTADGSWAYYENGAKVTNGWRQTNGAWYFLNADGVMMQNGWLKDGTGTWYYLAENGAMKTGWIQVSGNWYYLAPNGAMKTGWFQDTAGTWYYANESGVMLHDTTVGGYTLGSNGALV